MAGKSNRGFAGMDQEKQRAIASKGGKAAHAKGTAHKFTPEEARIAGRKGGQAAHQKGTAHEFTSEEARAAGRKGGLRSHGERTDAPAGRQEGNGSTGMNGNAGPHQHVTEAPPVAPASTLTPEVPAPQPEPPLVEGSEPRPF
jgi:general stress protein YciG